MTKKKDATDRSFANNCDANGYDTFSDINTKENTYTVQEAIDSLGFGRYQVKVFALIGLGLLAEGMSFMALTILAPVLKCTFFLTGTQEALLTTFMFLGMTVSSGAWGVLCDKHGRRITLLLFSVMTGYFGVLSSLSPVYEWILIGRFLVGFGLSGAPQLFTHCAEFLPTRSRAVVLLSSSWFWILGGWLEVVLAMVVSPTLGWRWLMVFTSAPFLLFAAFYQFLPESPHYYVAFGRYDKALEILESVATLNRGVLPQGSLCGPPVENVEKGRIKDLFVPGYRRTTILLCFMWVSWNVCYYGTGLLTSALFENYDGCHGYDSHSVVSVKESCHVACSSMTSSDYLYLLISSLGDIGGLPCSVLLFPKLGRRKTLALLSIIYGVAMALCNFCSPRYLLVLLLFIARVTSGGGFDSGMVYTAEVYPTAVRATGTGVCAMTSRFGLMLMPFIAEVLVKQSAYLSITFYAVLGLLGGVAAIFLTIETQNQDMKTTVEERIK